MQYHIAGRQEKDVGKSCNFTGDPGRCEAIASKFENAKLVVSNREFKTYTGTLLGERAPATSTGIGEPSAALGWKSCRGFGAHTIIRVGTCGGINMNE